MNTAQIKEIIRRELPAIMREDMEIQSYVLYIVRTQFPDKKETESRFDRVLDELRRDREEQSRKWDEQKIEDHRKWDEQKIEDNRKWDEQKKKWDEQNRKWEENQQEIRKLFAKWDEQKTETQQYREEQNQKWKENQQEIRKLFAKWDEQKIETQQYREEQNQKWEENRKAIRKVETGIGALGARWGIHAEESFRNGLKGILEESFGVEVLNVTEFDDTGEVFGSPDQVELDVIIRNGVLIICELKSSMSRGDVYIFNRKIAFYERRHDRKAGRKIIISPMLDKYARGVAENLNIEVYSYCEDIKEL